MIPVTTYNGKKVALFGLGDSGLATAKALQAGGALVVAWDDNPQSVEKAQNEGIATEDLREVGFADVSALVLAPGVPLTHPKPHWTVDLAQAHDVPIIGDVELFCRERRASGSDAPFIAITGTNGKSTTTALIAHILKSSGGDVQMGGNIGTPILMLEPITPERIYVVECSSYQIDLTPTLDPSIGILLNLSPDHLDRHGTMAHYASIKERLVAGSETAIIGIDDQYCERVLERLTQAGENVTPISKRVALTKGVSAKDEALCRNGKSMVHLAGIGSLRGSHNAQNAAAAYAACRSIGLSDAEIQAGMESFPGLEHRMEQVGHLGRVLFINDSKATNAEAAAPALSSFDRIYWIAGGLEKQGGITPLKSHFSRIAKAYLIGEAAPAFSATLGDDVAFEISGTLDAAVINAAREAADDPASEPTVLLSPACASFDQFPNFEIRGNAFKDAVLALEGIEPIGGTQ